MDLSTMENKHGDGAYASLESFEADFRLMIANCRLYNDAEVPENKPVLDLCTKLEDAGNMLFHAAHNPGVADADELMAPRRSSRGKRRRRK